MLIKMAWRNLWRSKRRTIITLVSIAFGLWLAISFTTLGDGGYAGYIDSAARMGAGHVTMEPIGYRDAPTQDKTIPEADKLAERIRGYEGIKDLTVRIVGQAMVSTAASTTGAAFTALDPDLEKGLFFILDTIKEGAGLKSKNDKGILIGKGMADQLHARIGSKIVVTSTDKTGEVVSGLFKVRGIFESGSDEVDLYMIVLPIDRMRSMLNYGEHEATQVAVLVKNQRKSGKIAEELKPDAEAMNAVSLAWFDVMPEVAGFIQMDRSSAIMFQILVLVLVAAGILNTVLMGVLERLREFGIMLAVGIQPSKLFRMVIWETFWLGFFGMIAGIAISSVTYWYLSTVGLDMSEMFSENQSISGVMWNPIMKAAFYPDKIAIILASVFALIMLSGLYPAFVASRIQPLKAIRMM